MSILPSIQLTTPPTPDGYHANRILAVLILVTAGTAALVWDLTPLDSVGAGGRAADWAARMDLTGIAEPMARLVDGVYKVGMLIALGVLSIYGIIQTWGAGADTRCLSRAAANVKPGSDGPVVLAAKCRILALLSPLSGRPVGLHAHLSDNSTRALHFGFGRRHLLEPMRLGLWAFPVVGFIGTVLGISQAVKDLPLAMKDETALSAVLDSLHLAFDTTFIGLVASVILMLQLYLLDARWTLNQEKARALDVSALEPALPASADSIDQSDSKAPVAAGSGSSKELVAMTIPLGTDSEGIKAHPDMEQPQ